MNDNVTTIASVVSAACAVIGVVIGVLGLSRPQAAIDAKGKPILSSHALYAFLLTSSGWVLAVLSFLWVLEPFGPFITEREYFQIVGIMVALPALMILRSGMRLLEGGKRKDASGNSTENSRPRNS
jgi:hypothetical protein